MPKAKPAQQNSKPLQTPAEYVLDLLLDAAQHVGIKEASEATRVTEILDGPEGLGDPNWLLMILAMQIDLKVEVPNDLIANHELTVGEFAKRISELPTTDVDKWTLICLNMAVEYFLSSECDCEECDCEECNCEDCDCYDEEPSEAPVKPAKKAAKPAKAAAKPAKRAAKPNRK